MDNKEIVDLYKERKSVRSTAAYLGIATQTVRRVLISQGIYTSARTQKIEQMRGTGLSDQEIAQRLGVTYKTVQSYAPYTKGSYKVGEKTENAKRIEEFRRKKGESKK